MRVVVFCTGGTELGYGHLFRSKTFVKSVPNDIDILLLPVVKEEDAHLFKELADVTKTCSNESEALQVCMAFNPDIFIFDTVECTDTFFSKVREHVALIASISPVFSHMNRVDLLFTRNIHTSDISNVTVFKGFSYAIFNEHCKFIPDEIYYHNLSREYLIVGVAMGGGDAPNKTLRVLRSIAKLEIPCMFWVLLGEGYRHSYQDLVTSIRRDSQHEIILAKTNRSMWNILSNCSLAILAGGLTTVESMYAGLPTLNIFEKEQHIQAMGREIFDQGIAENVGLFSEGALEQLAARLSHYSTNKSQLLAMREKSKGKIDKLAPSRIFDVLKVEFAKKLKDGS